MRSGMQRLTTTVEAVLAPGERLATTGVGWAAQRRPRVPVLFLGRRQYWFALTDRRILVFARHRGGPAAGDLVLGKRYSFLTLEKVHRHRLLFQLRVRGANDSRFVFEFRPRHRAVAAELAARLTRALPAGRPEPTPDDTLTDVGEAGGTVPAAPSADAEPDVDRDTAVAFWGDR